MLGAKKILTWSILVAFSLIIFSAVGCASSKQYSDLPVGAGDFTMAEVTGASQDDLKVFYYRPPAWSVDRPILIVLHGLKRNADEYRDAWIKNAEDQNFLVVCPEFTEKKFPGTRYYNLGNVVDEEEGGEVQPREAWTFSVIDRVFDEVRNRTGAKRTTFALFGHSAGSQFVHRYLLFNPETKADKIISANAGWYTMPDSGIEFPYGIKSMPVSNDELIKLFSRPIIIMLGEQDIKTGGVLRHTAQADEQGMNRLERGIKYFNVAKAKASELGVPFQWQLIIVPGVGHSDTGIGAVAAKLVAD